MSLAGWLDAGYAMLIEGADSIWRQLLEELFAASDDTMLERGFAALRAEAQHRKAQADKAEVEHRRRTGAPAHARLLPAGQLEQAVAEWEQITGGSSGSADEAAV